MPHRSATFADVSLGYRMRWPDQAPRYRRQMALSHDHSSADAADLYLFVRFPHPAQLPPAIQSSQSQLPACTAGSQSTYKQLLTRTGLIPGRPDDACAPRGDIDASSMQVNVI